MVETLSLLAAGAVIGFILAELRQEAAADGGSDDVLDELCSALEDPDRHWQRTHHTLDCTALGISVWTDSGPELWRPQKVSFSRSGRRRLRASMKVAAENALVGAAEKQQQRERLD